VRDLRVHAGRADVEIRPLRQQVADLAQKGGVGAEVHRLGRVCAVPIVDPGLQLVALAQQRRVRGREVADDGGERGPEAPGLHAGAGQGLVLHEGVQRARHLEARGLDRIRHRHLLSRSAPPPPGAGRAY
jgi:hypothetical protein